jgi:hypothetical protein
VKLELAVRAKREAARHNSWWRANREVSPDLFERELLRTLEQIEVAPRSGTPYSTATSGREYRRVLMPATRYYVYYRILAPDHVRVDAIWSAVRGKGPAL